MKLTKSIVVPAKGPIQLSQEITGEIYVKNLSKIKEAKVIAKSTGITQIIKVK